MNKAMNKKMQSTLKQVNKDWKRTRKALKKQWEKLTDTEVHHIDNQLDDLVDMLQDRYGETWEDATSALERYLGDYRERTRSAIDTTLHRRQNKMRTSPWLWALLLVGLAAAGYFWPSLSKQGKQLGQAWGNNLDQGSDLKGGSKKPNDTSHA